MSELTRLELRKAGRITASALAGFMNAASNLRSINFSCCPEINEIFVSTLNTHSHLEKINLRYCNNVTNYTVEVLATNSPNLKTLDLEGCKQCTDLALTHLSQKASALEELNIGCCPLMTDTGVETIAKALTGLKTLSLRSNNQLKNISAIAIGSHLARLEKLDIEHCEKISDEVFTTLRRNNLSCLQELNLSATAITSDALNKLAKMDLVSSLQALDLSGCNHIDWEALRTLEDFYQLKSLNIAGLELGVFYGLEPLKNCTALKNLYINHIRENKFYPLQSKDVISVIQEMPQLQEVSVTGLGQLEDYIGLRKDLKILYRKIEHLYASA